MSCCGSKRAALRTENFARSAPVVVVQPAPNDAVPLRPTTHAHLLLRGPYSGRAYRFTDTVATAVDACDVEALLRTGLLRRD